MLVETIKTIKTTLSKFNFIKVSDRVGCHVHFCSQPNFLSLPTLVSTVLRLTRVFNAVLLTVSCGTACGTSQEDSCTARRLASTLRGRTGDWRKGGKRTRRFEERPAFSAFAPKQYNALSQPRPPTPTPLIPWPSWTPPSRHVTGVHSPVPSSGRFRVIGHTVHLEERYQPDY